MNYYDVSAYVHGRTTREDKYYQYLVQADSVSQLHSKISDTLLPAADVQVVRLNPDIHDIEILDPDASRIIRVTLSLKEPKLSVQSSDPGNQDDSLSYRFYFANTINDVLASITDIGDLILSDVEIYTDNVTYIH